MAPLTDASLTVPVSQRWQWAKLQSKAWHEADTQPDAWSEPKRRGPLPTALAFWAYMIIWQPCTNGHGVIVPSRSRLGRASTIVAILVGIGVVVGVFRRVPWLGLGLGVVAFPIGVAWLAHTIGTWRLPAKCTYLANFIRRPESPKGSALPLFEAMCVNADHDRRTLALHTRQPRLVGLYEGYGFSVHSAPSGKGRVSMTRSPGPET